jgi:hypothetical protein
MLLSYTLQWQCAKTLSGTANRASRTKKHFANAANLQEVHTLEEVHCGDQTHMKLDNNIPAE